jgi:hypothetical protein
MWHSGVLASVLGVVVARVSAQSPNPVCIATKCGTQLAKCMANSMCRDAMACLAKCGLKNQSCAFQCTCDFETQVYDDLVFCMFNDNDCMGTKSGFDTWQKCRKDVKPLATYRGAPLTTEVARKLLERGKDRGDWLVTKGLSAAYDCFDCQMNYWLKNSDGDMQYFADFKVHKSNGSTQYNQGNYQAREFPGEVARYSLNASNDGGLRHEEDWRLIGADESDDPQWATMYYCGAAAGVGMAYEGAMLMTPDGMMPKDAATVAKIDAIFKANGLDLKCYPNNGNCGDHPSPPTPQSSQFFQIV